MSLNGDLFDLARHLNQERLFVQTEREALQKLYDEVRETAEELYHVSWISHQQRQNLDSLILSSHDATPPNCCSTVNQLECVNFVDSYKHLSHHDAKYGDLIKQLREKPALLAELVILGEKNMDSTHNVIDIILSSIYGNCVMQDDEGHMLYFLRTLVMLQLVPNSDPRRLLRKGSCAFSYVFKRFTDCLFSAKLFLMAALHDPIMRLLMEDEWFYDIDPNKAVVRFPAGERLKKFGTPGTSEYATNFKIYRKFIVDKLFVLASRFINSIRNNIHCFPSSLSWLISLMHRHLKKVAQISPAEVQTTCADLLFALFICPAICDPEPYGITSDIPISHIARHNLMQIAQIIQVLAISKREEIDPKVQDLYGQFDKDCLTSVVDTMVSESTEEPLVHSHQTLSNTAHSAVLMTPGQLSSFVSFLRTIVISMDQNSEEKKHLEELLVTLPNPMPNHLAITPTTTPCQTPPDTPSNYRKHHRANSGSKKKALGVNLDEPLTIPGDYADSENTGTSNLEDVLIISLGMDSDCPGMLSEQKVLSWEQENQRRRVTYHARPSFSDPPTEPEIQEKRTRFSLSNDQESIGNISDTQEGISEGASSHSVASEDDNFSDTFSANISGRITPNISGRDTPVSQAESNEEREPSRRAPDLPIIVQKTNREDVTDRFGKFDIKTQFERDETKSTVSDTWSTDVLASDSEPPEQNQQERLAEIWEIRAVSEVSETTSESAWSTDVLASDNEDKQSVLMADFDQEDVGSISDRPSNHEDLDIPEAGETNEDTPLASGDQSPTNDQNPHGAVGGPSHYHDPVQIQLRDDKYGSRSKSKPHANPALLSDEVFQDTEKRQRPVTDIIQSYQELKISKPFDKPQRYSESFKHAEGRVESVLMDLDPFRKTPAIPAVFLNPPSNGTTSLSSNNATTLPNNVGMAAWLEPTRDITTDSSISGSIPLLSEYSDNSSPRSVECNDFRETISPRDSGLADCRQAEIQGDPYILDVMATGLDETLNLAEQQNTKLSENRLSIDINQFDPLSEENRESVKLLEDSTSSNQSKLLLEAMTSNAPEASSAQVTTHNTQDRNQPINGMPLVTIPNGDCLTLTMDQLNDLEDSSPRRNSTDSGQSSSSSSNLNEVSPTKTDRSISNTSQKSDEVDEERNEKYKKGGLFHNIKNRINKGIRRKGKESGGGGDSPRFTGDRTPTLLRGEAMPTSDPKFAPSGSPVIPAVVAETSDAILERYRNKKTGQKSILVDPLESNGQGRGKRLSHKDDDFMDAPLYDPTNLENCFAFLDAKRKLRLVLSTGDFQITHSTSSNRFGSPPSNVPDSGKPRKDGDVVNLLKVFLAEAINLQDKDMTAQLHEAIRCVRQFDGAGCRKLIQSLQVDYKNRSAYISYLVRCKQGVLTMLSHLQRLHNRTKREKDICSKHLTNVCVRLFTESREKRVLKFMSDFQKLTVPDEKTDLVEQYMEDLYKNMKHTPIWLGASESQLLDAHLAMERIIMSRIYTHAMFPNGDGDILRDQLFQQHIKKLSENISVSHKLLRIPKVYHFECPWPSAQREIYVINAYKTPKDKLQCVVRCLTTIANLLSMANEKSVPGADDIIPVLLFVLIKANPACLLSTEQYVKSFYEKRLEGEEFYWWTMFESALRFLRTMDYTE